MRGTPSSPSCLITPASPSTESSLTGAGTPRYARVLAVASDGDYGFAVVDGNGDGAELEAESWRWYNGAWNGAGSSGAGPLSNLGHLRTGGQIADACFAYGRAPGHQPVTISFNGHHYDVPVSQHGVWAFIKIRTDPHRHEFPPWQLDKNRGAPLRRFPDRRDLRGMETVIPL
jgi:hypothetical protein